LKEEFYSKEGYMTELTYYAITNIKTFDSENTTRIDYIDHHKPVVMINNLISNDNKSLFINTIKYFQEIVLNNKVNIPKSLYQDETKPIKFEIEVHQHKSSTSARIEIYYYVEIINNKVVKEYYCLWSNKIGDNLSHFVRNNDELDYYMDNNESKKYNSTINSNNLLLHELYKDNINHEQFIEFIKNIKFYNMHTMTSKDLDNDKVINYKKKLVNSLISCDLLVNLTADIIIENNEIVFKRGTLGNIKFDEESTGFKYVFYYLYLLFINPTNLIIIENFDSNLHSLMISQLIEIYTVYQLGRCILTTNKPDVLNSLRTIGKLNIWFMDKDYINDVNYTLP